MATDLRMRRIHVSMFSYFKPGPSEGTQDNDGNAVLDFFKKEFKITSQDINEMRRGRKVEEVNEHVKNLGRKAGRYDVFFFIFLTTLESGSDTSIQLRFNGGTLPLQRIIDIVKIVPALAGKPKIFLVQADAEHLATKGPQAIPIVKKIPIDAEQLLIISTIPQSVVWKNLGDERSEDTACSYLIQAFIKVMKNRNKSGKDLLDMTVDINKEVFDKINVLNKDKYKDNPLPVPLVVSTLTKPLFV